MKKSPENVHNAPVSLAFLLLSVQCILTRPADFSSPFGGLLIISYEQPLSWDRLYHNYRTCRGYVVKAYSVGGRKTTA